MLVNQDVCKSELPFNMNMYEEIHFTGAAVKV